MPDARAMLLNRRTIERDLNAGLNTVIPLNLLGVKSFCISHKYIKKMDKGNGWAICPLGRFIVRIVIPFQIEYTRGI